MTERSDRESRALDALIVSRLRAGCENVCESGKHPAITEADKENLECLKDDFIDKLLAKPDDYVRLVRTPADVEHSQQPVGGLLRAEEFDGASADEVQRNREAIRAKAKESGDGATNQTGG